MPHVNSSVSIYTAATLLEAMPLYSGDALLPLLGPSFTNPLVVEVRRDADLWVLHTRRPRARSLRRRLRRGVADARSFVALAHDVPLSQVSVTRRRGRVRFDVSP
jgi:hypothetical protein